MEVKELFEEKLLGKIPASISKAKDSLTEAEKHLEKAQTLMAAKVYDYALNAAYTAMFHALRSILFRDGVREKSHYALIQYVIEKYSKELGLNELNQINFYRGIRHSAIYGFNVEIDDEEAADAIEFAEKMLTKITKFIYKK